VFHIDPESGVTVSCPYASGHCHTSPHYKSERAAEAHKAQLAGKPDEVNWSSIPARPKSPRLQRLDLSAVTQTGPRARATTRTR
jgi:hypothetical protein